MSETTLILGLGNILCGDEGIGCRIVEHLFATSVFPECVQIMDGGTMGQELLGRVMEADNLLVIDCGDFGQNPGESVTLFNDETPIWLGARKMSPHQSSFAEVLALAKLKSRLPAKLALLGVRPLKLAFGANLSPFLLKKIPEYASLTKDILKQWGIEASARDTTVFLNQTPAGLQHYEPDWRKVYENDRQNWKL